MTASLVALTAAGVAGFLGCLTAYSHAQDAHDPEPAAHRPAWAWAAILFAGAFLAGAAGLGGVCAAEPPSPLLVWCVACGAGLALHRAVLLLVRQVRRGRVARRGPAACTLAHRFSRARRAAAPVVLFAAVLVPAALPGCVGFAPALSAADRRVVLAERSLRADFEAVDALLTFDDNNRAWLRQHYPSVHEFCEYLRQPGPIGPLPPPAGQERTQRIVWAIRAAWDAHDRLRQTATEANAAALDVWADRVATWARQARKYLDETR